MNTNSVAGERCCLEKLKGVCASMGISVIIFENRDNYITYHAARRIVLVDTNVTEKHIRIFLEKLLGE